MLTFVSYSRQDEAFVLKLVKDLRERAVRIWLDQVDIAPGTRWDVAIERALVEATHFLLVLSEASSKSENVRDELDFAIENGKTIIPILIDECTPPLRVRRLQRINFQSNYDSALAHLLTILPHTKINETPHHQVDISGQWIRLEDNCVLFFKQRGNRAVGIYDRGAKRKIGVYLGRLKENVYDHEWKWFEVDLEGDGQLTLSSEDNTLSGSWWYKTDDTKYYNTFDYLSKVMPDWLTEADFALYEDFLQGHK